MIKFVGQTLKDIRIRGLAALAVLAIAAVAAVGVNTQRADAAPPILANSGGSYGGAVGVPIQFNGMKSIGTGLQYHWNFGDGTTGFGHIVEHTYGAPGVYQVTLTVRDVFGQASQSETTAQVAFRPGAVTVLGPAGCVMTAAGIACAGIPAGCAVTAAGLVCPQVGTVVLPQQACIATLYGVSCLGLQTTAAQICAAYGPSDAMCMVATQTFPYGSISVADLCNVPFFHVLFTHPVCRYLRGA